MIFVDAVNINTGGATIEAFPPPINLIVGDSSTPVVSLDPPDGQPGDTNLKINGFNFESCSAGLCPPYFYLTDPFNGKKLVDVTWSSADIASNGTISGTYTIPANVTSGNHVVQLTAKGISAYSTLNVFTAGSSGITTTASPSTLNLAPPPDTSLSSPSLTVGYDAFGSFNDAAGVNFTISGLPPGMTAFW